MGLDDFRKLLCWSILLYIPIGIVSVALPLYFQEIGFSYTQIGLIYSIGPIIGFFAGYFAGTNSDFSGRKKYLIFSSAFLVLYFLVLFLAFDSWQFALASILFSASSAIVWVISGTYLSDILPKNKVAKLMGIYSGLSGMASVLGMLFVGTLLIYLGYKELFLLCAFLGIFALVLSAKLHESRKKLLKPTKVHIFFDFSKLSKEVKFLFWIGFLVNFFCQIITAFGFPLYFKSMGASTAIIGLLMGFLWFGPYISQIIFGKLADKHTRRVWTLTFAIIIPANICLIFVQNYVVASTLLLIQGMAFGIQSMALTKLQFNAMGKNNGHDYAFMYGGYFLAIMAGAIVGGIVMDNFGFSGIFVLRVLGFIISAGIMLVSLRYFKK